MTEIRESLSAIMVGDEMFKIFDEGREVFSVHVSKDEDLAYAMCDECKKNARGIGHRIHILELADANANPVKVDALQFAQILVAIRAWCFESHCRFICDGCAEKQRKKIVEVPKRRRRDVIYVPRYGQWR